MKCHPYRASCLKSSCCYIASPSQKDSNSSAFLSLILSMSLK
uniref:Uncharacterized protein n=1 Tax=Anguilla anguilla TaxID=7936 RepID=A0A0E9RQQ0_ANGAN